MKKLVALTDWVNDDLSCQEFRSVVEGFLKDSNKYNISFVSSTPSTIHIGFLLLQIVETEERYNKPLERVIFQNTDNHFNMNGQEKIDKGSNFLVIRLKSGIYLCGPNAGYNFSFIKDKIDEVYFYANLENKGQFRSRDLYARICAHLMDEMEDELDLEETRSNIIPDLTGFYVGHIDNFGNIKTNITYEEFKGKYEYGDMVKVKINNKERKARFVNNMFGGSLGELVIFPGSSGHKDNPFLEISVWRHFTEKDTSTGFHLFDYPKPGMEIILSK